MSPCPYRYVLRLCDSREINIEIFTFFFTFAEFLSSIFCII